IAYDDEGGGWAGRLIWTLDVLGHGHASLLNGGLVAWTRAGHAVESAANMVPRSSFAAHIDRSQIATREQVAAQIDDPGSMVWDARGADEFHGRKVTALRNGHIPNAVNLDWLDLMDPGNDLRLRPLEDIRAHLGELGITSDTSVITHCQTHHRSGLAYVVGKALGLDIRAYDGSWSEWGNLPDTPVET
ncbi:MAG: rhodanese-like domain-containing protein, partial [Gammaproteobacteria bacterium]